MKKTQAQLSDSLAKQQLWPHLISGVECSSVGNHVLPNGKEHLVLISDPGDSHIELSVSKHKLGKVDSNPLQCLALGLVDAHGERQLEGELAPLQHKRLVVPGGLFIRGMNASVPTWLPDTILASMTLEVIAPQSSGCRWQGPALHRRSAGG
jgi:hypothetical protein